MSLLNSDQILINILTVWIIQVMKRSKAPFLAWINKDSAGVNKIVATVGALLTTAGITFAWLPESGTLTITGLTVGGFATLLLEVLKNYAFQHVIYKSAFKTPDVLGQIMSAPADVNEDQK